MPRQPPTHRQNGRQASTPMFDRAPPYDPEAEIGVLGSIMLLPSVLDGVANILETGDFYDEPHRLLYETLLGLRDANKTIDPVLLCDELKSRNYWERVGGAAYLGKIMHAVPNAAHAVFYAEIVVEKSLLRKLIEAGTEMLRKAYDCTEESGDAAAQIAEAETSLQTVSYRAAGSVGEARRIKDVATEVMDQLYASLEQETSPGFYAAIGNLDQQLGPIMPAELTIVAARPGEGKTALAIQYANECTRSGRKCFYASLEMPAVELGRREVTRLAGIDSRDLRALQNITHEAIENMTAVVNHLQQTDPGWWLWRKANATVAQIRAAARRVKAQDGCDLLVVDHIGWLRPTGPEKYEDRRTQVGFFTKQLKELAAELKCGLIVLCQLNRDAQDKLPTLANLRDSGAIEEDADCVLFLHHPPEAQWIEHPGGGKTQVPDDQPRRATLNIGKHRHVGKGDVTLSWIPMITTFGNPPEELPP